MKWLTALALLIPSVSSAHGLDGGMADIRISGAKLYAVITPSAQLLARFDTNRDGLIQREETRAHRSELLAWFLAGFRLSDEKGRHPKLVFQDVSTPRHGPSDHQGAHHLRLTLRFVWKTPPSVVSFDYEHGQQVPMQFRVQRFSAAQVLPHQQPKGLPLLHTAGKGTTRFRFPAAP